MYDNFLARTKYLFIISLSFIFNLRSSGLAKSFRWQFFFLINTTSSFLDRNRWSVYISKSQRILYVYVRQILLYVHTIRGHSKILNLLHNFQWITFPAHSCFVLYSFCASLLRSFIQVFVYFVIKRLVSLSDSSVFIGWHTKLWLSSLLSHMKVECHAETQWLANKYQLLMYWDRFSPSINNFTPVPY